MKNKISPSMMCVDFMNIKETLAIMEAEKIEYLHIDIMDGSFVQNYTLGTDFCKMLKSACNIPLDLHLMIEKPELKLDWFPIGKGDYVSVHAESTCHLQRVLGMIREKGAKPMVALNPATPVSALDYVLDDIDGVLVMTVNPGFSGQKLIPQTIQKIRDVRSYLNEKGYPDTEIEVDGNVSFENALRMKDAGANIFVAGTSGIFRPDLPLASGIAKLRNVLQ